MEISKEQIREILPHGAGAVVIESVQSRSGSALEATATVQDSSLFLDNQQNYIPEIALELVGQAAALGSALNQTFKPGRRGVIAKVRHLSFESSEPVCNSDKLFISVLWEQIIPHVTDIRGEIRLSNNGILARVDCTVVEIA